MSVNKGIVQAIFISPAKKQPMQRVKGVLAIFNMGLEGDWHCRENQDSMASKKRRQVTLINGVFFEGTGFDLHESRRNIVTNGVELMSLIGQTFKIGDAVFRGLEYCAPCKKPSRLAGKDECFVEAFHDRAGLVAEVVLSGKIDEGSEIIQL